MSGALTRDDILRRLEQWVDSAFAAEEPPAGIDPEILARLNEGSPGVLDGSCDSYALWSAMTALSQEVKLQGRAFKELNDTLGAQASRMAEELRAEHGERERDLERDADRRCREAERRCRKDALGVLIDLRDRMGRGIETVRTMEAELAKPKPPAGWRERLFGKPVPYEPDPRIEALVKGYQLALERLDQALADSNAREISCAGQAFDPRRMNAIDREESSTIPEGTVLEVYRSGYEWNGEVFRPAQVKVSYAPAGKPEAVGEEK